MKLRNLPLEPIPAGKRSVKNNVWGNCNAYVGGRFWDCLGVSYSAAAEERAELFLAGEEYRR